MRRKERRSRNMKKKSPSSQQRLDRGSDPDVAEEERRQSYSTCCPEDAEKCFCDGINEKWCFSQFFLGYQLFHNVYIYIHMYIYILYIYIYIVYIFIYAHVLVAISFKEYLSNCSCSFSINIPHECWLRRKTGFQ